MALRNGVLGLAGVLAATALAAAAPPVNPLVEGRELDPVAREFHQPDRPTGGYVSGSSDSDETSPGGWVVIAAGVWDVLFEQFTVPLGTAIVAHEPPDGA